ncbi:MAG: sigma-70 family RNA polymerase sigma factor [Capsulimonadaceae bacterium]|nr:sigma-70 family RNA polymerase sigma factor [Capsulimonadaceae bacterium]
MSGAITTRSDPKYFARKGIDRDYWDLRYNFDALMARYEKRVYNLVLQWVRDFDEAFDLTQETFINAYQSRTMFRGDARVYTWLYQIAFNKCKNRFKREGRRKEFEAASLDNVSSDYDDRWAAEAHGGAACFMSPETLLVQKELLTQIYQAVDELPTAYQTVFFLREVEGLSYTDLAAVTGISVEALKSRLLRARRMIRCRIEAYYRKS